MRIIDLIRDYDRTKSAFSELPQGLSEKLTQLMRVFGQMPANSSGDAIARRAAEHWSHAKPGTIARMVRQLRAVYALAERAGVIARAPYIQAPSVHDVRDVQVSAEEIEYLLDHIEATEPAHYLAFVLLCHTGGRLSEVLRLTGADLTPDYVVIRKPVAGRTKTVSRRIPVTLRVKAAIANAHVSKSDTVLSLLGVRHNSAKGVLRHTLLRSCESIGIPPLRVHDLRHSFAALIAAKGGDLSDIASALGHSNVAMSYRYRGLVKSRLTSIIERV